MIVESLREALYRQLETKEIGEIKVVDLTKEAGVSRGAFYKHFYLVTDILKDDIRMIADDVRGAIGSDIKLNWMIILQTIYTHKNKIPLLLKAGMGLEILNQINRSIDAVDEPYKLRIMAWNGVIINSIVYWAGRNFDLSPEELAAQLTEITSGLYNDDVAVSFEQGMTLR